MSSSDILFRHIGKTLLGSELGSAFGIPCFSINGQPFIGLAHTEMVFRLPGHTYQVALSLDGSSPFVPQGHQHPVTHWIRIPFDYHDRWPHFAAAALAGLLAPNP